MGPRELKAPAGEVYTHGDKGKRRVVGGTVLNASSKSNKRKRKKQKGGLEEVEVFISEEKNNGNCSWKMGKWIFWIRSVDFGNSMSGWGDHRWNPPRCF